jgi:RsiW-degrading membrane proteinase PrsW (M82 family)
MDDSPQPTNNMGRWLWLKILISGLIMFFLIEYALKTTGNINYVPSLLLVGTFTIPLSFMVLLYSRNKAPGVSVISLLSCMLWGGILGTVLAGSLEFNTVIRLGTLPTIAIGVIEEGAKLVIPAILIIRHRKHSELDSIVIGAAAGAGFAAFESMGYGLVALLVSGGNLTDTTQLLLLRGLMAPAAHIAWTALVADALWRFMHRAQSHAVRHFMTTFFGVVLLHAVWDSETPLGQAGYVILGLISLSWLLIRVRRSTSADTQRRVDPRLVEA